MTVKKVDQKNDAFRELAANCPTGVLAELLGLTQAVVSRLYQTRVIIQNGRRGKYDLFDTIPKYLQSIRTSGTAEAGEKLKIQQERKLKIANDVAAGELIKIADAAEVFRASTLSWRAGASALPRRLATELSNQGDAAKVRETLSNEIDELFKEWEKPLRAYFGDSWGSDPAITTGGDRPKTVRKKKPGRLGGRKSNPSGRKRGTGKVAK